MDLKVSELMAMQEELQEKYKESWAPLTPENGRNKMLWMIEEVGESIAIIKKRGDTAIMEDREIRSAFVEELVDVMMYYHCVLLSYDITPEEWSSRYLEKHNKNMKRDYKAEYTHLLEEGSSSNNENI